MKKLLLLGLLFVTAGINCCYGQSRGIKYTMKNVTLPAAANVTDNKSSTFEIANENVMVHIPIVNQNRNRYSVLSRFDSNLCYLGSKKIPENIGREFYFGVSKNDGGFATNSWFPPYVIRNYDNQGNLLFSKKIIDNNLYNPNRTGIYPKIVANPDSNNLYFAYNQFSNETHDSIPNLIGSPLVNIIEISPTGSLVNAFQFKIPYTTRYLNTNGSGTQVIYTWNDGVIINDIKYVKGPFGPASDRIWVTIDLTPWFSYVVDANNKITSQQSVVPFTLGTYTTVLVIQSNGNSGDATLLTNANGNRGESIVISKASQGFTSAQMMIMKMESQVPFIYKFNDYTNSSPNNVYKFPFSVPGNLTSRYGSLKNHQGKILFGIEKYFGTFDEGSLDVNVRHQSLNNAPILGAVNYNTRDTNKLYLNYNDNLGAPTNFPMTYLIKENISDFKITCSSVPFLIQKAVSATASSFKLDAFTTSISGISLVNESYTEIIDNSLIRSEDVCLRICAAGRLSSEISSNHENLEIVLHPNPTENYFELTTELSIEKVEIYSMIGQLVKTFELQNQYAITDLAKGSYIVKITTLDGISNKTLIIE